jgi:hypothetical protein
VLQIEQDIFEIQSKYSLTFIDFGFSCLGSTETHISDISLSTVYSKFDPCPKEGRDMYLFLSLLYIDFHSKLPDKLLILFESWINTSPNMISFMRKDIYLGLNKEVGPTLISCRMMPVFHDDKINWIGIYVKKAFL